MVLYAGDIMRKDFSFISSDLTVLDASKIMVAGNSGFLIISDSNEPKGILTEWDIVSKVTAKELDPTKVLAKDIMTTNFVSVPINTPTIDLVETMKKNKIRRLPVMDKGKMVGVITSRDILGIFSDYVDNVTEIASKFGTY
ncbi:MAG: CBS domain-containing protein [Thermoplasmataceae archaeon]